LVYGFTQLFRDGLLVEVGTAPPAVVIFEVIGQLFRCFGHGHNCGCNDSFMPLTPMVRVREDLMVVAPARDFMFVVW